MNHPPNFDGTKYFIDPRFLPQAFLDKVKQDPTTLSKKDFPENSENKFTPPVAFDTSENHFINQNVAKQKSSEILSKNEDYNGCATG